MKLVVALSFLAAVQAATRVAVIELGVGGTVRRTTSTSPKASVAGVSSFWNALHGRRHLQESGMTVVPDLFRSADSSIVIGLTGSGVDLDMMPNVLDYVSKEDRSVGHMELSGHRCHDLVNTVPEHEDVQGAMKDSVFARAQQAGLSAIHMLVDGVSSHSVDTELAETLDALDAEMKSAGKTCVIHLVVDEDDAYVSRQLGDRRLDEADAAEGNNAAEDDDAGNGQQSLYPGYYTHGYYNAFDEWVTSYKTMFQIHYFNLVLWTSVGLILVLLFCLYLMVFMPLEPDTLLFGESAKMVGDD